MTKFLKHRPTEPGRRLAACLLTAALICGILPLSGLLAADPGEINITDAEDQNAFDQGMRQLEEYNQRVEQLQKEQEEKAAQQTGLNGPIRISIGRSAFYRRKSVFWRKKSRRRKLLL